MLQATQSETLKHCPIMVVDDEPVNLKLINRILAVDGFNHILSIDNPFEVISQYEKERPDLILLDINMPAMDGFALVEKLKSLPEISLPPIVFLTAQTGHEFRIKAFESGVMDFISKPFNRVELLSRVKNLLALESARHELSEKNNTLEQMVRERTKELRETQLRVVQKLGRAAEYRDNETGAHILRMSHGSALLAKHMGFNETDTENLLHASAMHDVGKIAIPDHILLKPGSFTDEEWEIMRSHTTLGYDILQNEDCALLNLASEIAHYHHEKWDGSGYPEGLKGEDIPLSCRIVAVADVFDALISERPYKKAWKIEDAHDFINEQSGKHFDPSVVDVFNEHFNEILLIREQYKDPEAEDDKRLIIQSVT